MMRIWAVLALLWVFLIPQPARALDGTALEIEIIDGAVGIIDPLALESGGTEADLSATGGALQFVRQNAAGAVFTVGLIVDADVPNDIVIDHTTVGTLDLDREDPTTNEGRIAWDATNNQIWVGEAAAVEVFIPTGTLVDTNFCTYDSTANEIDCNTAATGINPVMFFSSIGTISIGTATIYAVPGDVGAGTDIQTPVMGSTYRNLRCVSDTTTGGTGIVVTGRSGVCAATALAASSLTVTVTTANTEVPDVTNTMTPTVGHCIQFSMAATGPTTSAARVTCSVERSA